jgi:outer membrane protein TolC
VLGDCALIWPRCLSVARRLPWIALILVVAAGCTRGFFRKRADNDVENLLTEKSIDPRWEVEGWYVYPDRRARFADFDKRPDRPRKPPDDPAAAALSPDSQPIRSHLHKGSEQEGLGYLEFLKYCDQHNRSILARGVAEDGKPKASLGQPGQAGYNSATPVGTQESIESALRTGEQGYLVTLDQALELSLFNSRDYQDRREDLYLSALPVTQQRFNFYPQLFAGVNAIREWRASDVPGGPGSFWDITSTGTVTQLFPTGAQLVARLANQVVIELGTGNPTIGVSNLTLSVVQPLLQGGGWAVTLEPLTQAERSLVYGVRSYARFRKNYYVFIAGGGDLGNGVYGYDGLVNPGGGLNAGGSIGSPSQGYLPTLLTTAFERNERENIRALMGYMALYREYQGRGDFSELQVGQVEQGILRGQSSLLQRQQELQNGLDLFKLQLGVPTRTPLQLDDGPLRSMKDMLDEFAKARDEFQSLRTEADQLRNSLRLPLQALAGSGVSVVPLDIPLRAVAEKLVLDSTVTRATKDFRANIGPRWDRWRKMTTEEIRAEIKKEAEELRFLQVEEARVEARNEKLSDEQAARLEALPRDLAIGNLELALRLFEAAQARKGATVRDTAVLYEAVVNDFIRVMSEAREERRALLREKWPKLPAISVDGADLLVEDLDRSQTVAAQAALANRLELMNARGQVVDAWRRIAVAANSLLGVLNVGYNFSSPSPANANEPFALGGSRSTHQLIINGELPLVRRQERNIYRAALIAYQRSRRNLQATEDFILSDVRNDLRSLRVLAENYKIQQRAVELAFDQVENSLDILQAPPIPEGGAVGQPGRAAAQSQQQAANAASLTQQLLQQQNNLLQAQNSLYQVWVNYLIARMTFYRDIERLPLDPRGVWIDEFSTSPPVEPEQLPAPGPVVDPDAGGFADLRSGGLR